MTELQFLIDLFLNHKLSPTTKKLVAERIGIVEEQLRTTTPKPITPVLQRSPTAQAASTQAILDRDASLDTVPNSTPIVLAPLPAIPPSALAINRIVGGDVNTGRGSRGPRKF